VETLPHRRLLSLQLCTAPSHVSSPIPVHPLPFSSSASFVSVWCFSCSRERDFYFRRRFLISRAFVVSFLCFVSPAVRWGCLFNYREFRVGTKVSRVHSAELSVKSYCRGRQKGFAFVLRSFSLSDYQSYKIFMFFGVESHVGDLLLRSWSGRELIELKSLVKGLASASESNYCVYLNMVSCTRSWDLQK
jgi:hypothetical protein